MVVGIHGWLGQRGSCNGGCGGCDEGGHPQDGVGGMHRHRKGRVTVCDTAHTALVIVIVIDTTATGTTDDITTSTYNVVGA